MRTGQPQNRWTRVARQKGPLQKEKNLMHKRKELTLIHWSATIAGSATDTERKASTKGYQEDISAKKIAGGTHKSHAQPGALDRQLECASNLTTTWTRKTSKTSESRNNVGTENVKASPPESKPVPREVLDKPCVHHHRHIPVFKAQSARTTTTSVPLPVP